MRFNEDVDEWAAAHGITVGHCRVYKVKVWDETCDECDREKVYYCVMCDMPVVFEGHSEYPEPDDGSKYCYDCAKEEGFVFTMEEGYINTKDGWQLCGECEEYRYEDSRVEGGMKCGVCAYV